MAAATSAVVASSSAASGTASNSATSPGSSALEFPNPSVSHSISAGAIAGIVIGVLLAAILAGTLIACTLRRRNRTRPNTTRRLEADDNTAPPAYGVANAELEKGPGSNLEVVQASQAFQGSIPPTAVQPAPQDQIHWTVQSSATSPPVASDVRQEYERVVQRRARLQEIMRLEDEEQQLLQRMQASSTGPPAELPPAEHRIPAELPP
jgi:hypothetical protein